MRFPLFLAGLFARHVFALPHPPHSVSIEQRQYSSNSERANAVKEAFQFAWDGYYKYAFPHDELHPVTNGHGDSRNGWGASAVDALSTALIMDLPDIVKDIVDYIPTIDFSKTNSAVSLFETTIRYLGGLISGYDLLTGPLSHLYDNETNINALLSQAEYLGSILSFAFDTPSGVPYNNLDITSSPKSSADNSDTNGLATTGTLVLEWQHLSDLSGNETYGDLAQRAESNLLNPSPSYNVPFPGLLGTDIDINSGSFVDASGGWQGGDDSYYEYLLKMYVYDPARYAEYRDRWIQAADSTIQYLASHPNTRPDLTFLAEFNNRTLVYESQHLACFAGGSFLLGGSVLGDSRYTDFGLSLVDGCHDTYASTATGIGPEVFAWYPADGTSSDTVPADQSDFYDQAGFWIVDSGYDLRPEVLESYYYAYRLTGDSKYQDWAWAGFQAINATTRVGSGFSAVSDVNTPGGGSKNNNMESFLFAEVMKYAYLIFADDAPYQVQQGGGNQWVFNTEAHPFRVSGGGNS